MPVILLATKNPLKVQLFEPVFQDYGFDVLSLFDIQQDRPPPTETGQTAIENALAKARHYQGDAFPWVFGDDAGLEIDALNGEPGLQARRWAGRFPDGVEDQTWLDYLLERMRDVPPGERGACIVSGWALVAPDGREYVREVRWPFRIAERPIRPMIPGSPISAVRIGPQNDLASRRMEIQREWRRWGILARLGFP